MSPPAAEAVRRAMVVSYRGDRYCGWQRQPNGTSVQGTLEQAIEMVLGQFASVVGAGRTDAGVHALGQVAHLDVRPAIPNRALVLGVNRHLPDDVRVLAAATFGSGFHARKSAAGKTYRYRLSQASVIDALAAPRTVPLPRGVELGAVRAAARLLVGTHDFSAFAKSGGAHGNSFRELYSVQVEERGELVELTFSGSGFLRGMVRALVGTLIDVGLGRTGVDSVAALLDGGRRADAGANAPARGLVLAHVWYPNDCRAVDPFPDSAKTRFRGPAL